MYNSQKKQKALLNRAFRLERRFFRCQTEKHEKMKLRLMRGKIDVFISKYLYYIIIPHISQGWCKIILKKSEKYAIYLLYMIAPLTNPL